MQYCLYLVTLKSLIMDKILLKRADLHVLRNSLHATLDGSEPYSVRHEDLLKLLDGLLENPMYDNYQLQKIAVKPHGYQWTEENLDLSG